MLVPPFGGTVDLPLCALGDAYVHGVSAVPSGKLRENLFGGDRFRSVGLGKGIQQFQFLLRRQLESTVIVVGQDCHDRAFLERNSLENHLASDDSSGGDLHGEKHTLMSTAPGAAVFSKVVHFDPFTESAV